MAGIVYVEDSNEALRRVMKVAASTNVDICSPQERRAGLELLQSLLQNHAALTGQIANVGSADDLSLLETKRNDISSGIRMLRLAIAPHKRLPPEILSKIFVSTLASVREPIAYPTYAEQVPWVLSRVSSLWRKMAKADPLLWSRVRIILRGRDDESRARALTRAVSFLQEIFPRTGPLHLILINLTKTANVLESLVQPYLSRLKELHVSFEDAQIHGIDKLPPQSFLHIQDLGILVSPPMGRATETWTLLNQLQIFHHMRNLRALAFNCPLYVSDLSIALNLGIPLSQLTSLDLSRLSTAWVQDIIPFLQLCISVENYVHPSLLSLSESPDERVLPKLRSLTVSNVREPLVAAFHWGNLVDLTISAEIFDDDHLNLILNTLASCTNLETLKPQIFYEEPGDGPKRIITMPNVRTLILSNPEDWLLDCLKLSKLVEIQIDQRYISDDIQGKLLLDLVTRSECSIRRLRFRWVTLLQNFSTTPDDAFLKFLFMSSSLKELYIQRIKFDESVWRDIAGGILLPRLRVLEINISSPISFVEAVERQVRRRGELMVASGYYDGELSEAEQRLGDRLLELNLLVGTDFRLVKHQFSIANLQQLWGRY